MIRTSKLILVIGGYLVALLAAIVVTHARVQATSGPEWQGYSGMLAFGDSVLFLGVFSVAAIPASCGALMLLRPVDRFWRAAATTAVLVSATAVLALLLYLTLATRGTSSGLGPWFAWAPLRLLLSPLFAGASLLTLLFTPARSQRRAFLAAALLEAGAFAAAALTLLFRH